MKKLLAVVCVFCVLTLFVPGAARAQYPKFGFKLYGGLNYLAGGDLTNSTTGWSTFYHDYWALPLWGSLNFAGDYKPAHLGADFGGELILEFTPNIAVGLGAGYLQATKETAYNFPIGGMTFAYDWKVSASAIPITASLIYTLPASSQFNIFFEAGVGYYVSVKATQENDGFLPLAIFWPYIIGRYTDAIDGTSSGIGFHGGLGLEFVASPNFSIFLEAKGRYANIGGFDKANETGHFIDLGGATVTINNANMYLQKSNWSSVPGLSSYDVLGVAATIPAGATEAKVDLSGFSVLLGIIIRL